jgi:hypothetical protein
MIEVQEMEFQEEEIQEEEIQEEKPHPLIKIIDSVRTNTCPPSLSLRGFETDLFADFAQALSCNTTLHSLDLSGGHLYNVEAPIADFIRANTTLTSLDLSDNLLDAGGSIARALRHNTTLTSIDMHLNYHLHSDHNPMGGVARMLLFNTTLTSCSIDVNHLNDYEAGDIACALDHNSSLTFIGPKARWDDEIKWRIDRNKNNQLKRPQSLYEILFMSLLL